MITLIAACCAGWAYAAVLWFLAQRVARARGLRLGVWPTTMVGLCGLLSAAIVEWFTLPAAVPLSAGALGAIVCATIDARTGYIFDAVSSGVALVAGSAALACGRGLDGAAAAAAVGAALLLLYWTTRRRGIGLGDVKLAAAMALGYGVALSAIAVGSAFVLGAAYAGVLIGTGRATRSDSVRFGPFIAGGAVVAAAAGALGYRW